MPKACRYPPPSFPLPQVVPRQTCHLFTHNYLLEEFGIDKMKEVGVAKGGGEELRGMANRGEEGLRGVAEGGEVFHTVLYNPVR